MLFQSTPPARGATFTIDDNLSISDISIHAPREGGDYTNCIYKELFGIFQSTPPARGATYDATYFKGLASISIHAPREGGDI